MILIKLSNMLYFLRHLVELWWLIEIFSDLCRFGCMKTLMIRESTTCAKEDLTPLQKPLEKSGIDININQFSSALSGEFKKLFLCMNYPPILCTFPIAPLFNLCIILFIQVLMNIIVEKIWKEMGDNLDSFTKNNAHWPHCLEFALLPHRVSRPERSEYTPAYITYGR